MDTSAVIVAFWERVDKRGPDECWEWRGGRLDPKGYGGFYRRDIRKPVRAHRFSYELAHGPIPDGLFVCHRCDNPPCVNPAHLFSGTTDQNMADMVAKGRQVRAENVNTAILTAEQAKAIRLRYAAGETNHWRLGREYGVTGAAIRLIVTGVNWKDAGGPISTKRPPVAAVPGSQIEEMRRLNEDEGLSFRVIGLRLGIHPRTANSLVLRARKGDPNILRRSAPVANPQQTTEGKPHA